MYLAVHTYKFILDLKKINIFMQFSLIKVIRLQNFTINHLFLNIICLCLSKIRYYNHSYNMSCFEMVLFSHMQYLNVGRIKSLMVIALHVLFLLMCWLSPTYEGIKIQALGRLQKTLEDQTNQFCFFFFHRSDHTISSLLFDNQMAHIFLT